MRADLMQRVIPPARFLNETEARMGLRFRATFSEHASAGVSDVIQLRAIDYWTNVDAGLGARIASGLGRDVANAA
jgi:catalase